MNDRDISFHNAVVSYKRKNFDLALQLFDESLNAPFLGGQNTDALIINNKAMCLRQLKRNREAYECLMQCQKLGLDNEIVRKNIESLRKILT